MAESKMTYTTTEPEESKRKPLGSRFSNSSEIFNSSPIYSKNLIVVEGYSEKVSLGAPELKTWFLNNVVNGTVPNSSDYYGYPGGLNLDFSGAPNMNNVETGGAGLPATPYVPNPSSPGSPEDGSINVDYTSIPASPEFAKQQSSRNPNNYGSDLARTGMNSNSPERNPVNSSVRTNLNSFLFEKGSSETKKPNG